MRRNEMKLLSTTQVGEMIGFQPRTVARWLREGRFPSARKLGRVWRIPVTDDDLQTMVKTRVR